MNFTDLGYTKKWLDYGLLTEEILNRQYVEFQKGEDLNIEHYRYATFLNWLNLKEYFTDVEIKNYIELALEDKDVLMAGAAVKELFTHSKISRSQFELIKQELPQFGNWTVKLIQREELKKSIENNKLTKDLVKQCINHSKQFNENILIELIIHKTNKMEIIEQFTKVDFGKKIRNLANEKLRSL